MEGSRLLGRIGNVNLSLQPIESSTELYPFCSDVDLYVNIARLGSSHFLKNPYGTFCLPGWVSRTTSSMFETVSL